MSHETQPERQIDQSRAFAVLQAQRNQALDTVAMQEGHIAALEQRLGQLNAIVQKLQTESDQLQAELDKAKAETSNVTALPVEARRSRDMNSAAP